MPRYPKIYAATHDAAVRRPFILLDGTVEAAQSYVDTITNSSWWIDHCKPSEDGTVPIRVFLQFTEDPGWGAGIVYDEDQEHYYEGKLIPTMKIGKEPSNGEVPPLADVWVLLHELAHVCEPEEYHGKNFIYAYLKLVRRFLGIKHHDELVQCMRDHQIRVNYRSILNGNNFDRASARLDPQ